MTTTAPTPTPAKRVHPVDEVLPVPKLAAYGFQHVLAFYAGAVLVPILVANALGLSSEQLIHLINADLFTCGIASIIQSVGFWKIGVKLPLLQGVTFTAVSPMIAIGLAVGGGLYLPATAATILILGILFGLKPLENRLNASRRNLGALSVEIDPMRISRAAVEATIARGNARIMHADMVATHDGARRVVQLIVTAYSRVELDQLEQTIRALNGVETVTMNRI